MISISRTSKIVEAIMKEAVDFPTQEAMEKYLKDHPGADKSNHKVVELPTLHKDLPKHHPLNRQFRKRIEEKKREREKAKLTGAEYTAWAG